MTANASQQWDDIMNAVGDEMDQESFVQQVNKACDQAQTQAPTAKAKTPAFKAPLQNGAATEKKKEKEEPKPKSSESPKKKLLSRLRKNQFVDDEAEDHDDEDEADAEENWDSYVANEEDAKFVADDDEEPSEEEEEEEEFPDEEEDEEDDSYTGEDAEEDAKKHQEEDIQAEQDPNWSVLVGEEDEEANGSDDDEEEAAAAVAEGDTDVAKLLSKAGKEQDSAGFVEAKPKSKPKPKAKETTLGLAKPPPKAPILNYTPSRPQKKQTTLAQLAAAPKPEAKPAAKPEAKPKPEPVTSGKMEIDDEEPQKGFVSHITPTSTPKPDTAKPKAAAISGEKKEEEEKKKPPQKPRAPPKPKLQPPIHDELENGNHNFDADDEGTQYAPREILMQLSQAIGQSVAEEAVDARLTSNGSVRKRVAGGWFKTVAPPTVATTCVVAGSESISIPASIHKMPGVSKTQVFNRVAGMKRVAWTVKEKGQDITTGTSVDLSMLLSPDAAGFWEALRPHHIAMFKKGDHVVAALGVVVRKKINEKKTLKTGLYILLKPYLSNDLFSVKRVYSHIFANVMRSELDDNRLSTPLPMKDDKPMMPVATSVVRMLQLSGSFDTADGPVEWLPTELLQAAYPDTYRQAKSTPKPKPKPKPKPAAGSEAKPKPKMNGSTVTGKRKAPQPEEEKKEAPAKKHKPEPQVSVQSKDAAGPVSGASFTDKFEALTKETLASATGPHPVRQLGANFDMQFLKRSADVLRVYLRGKVEADDMYADKSQVATYLTKFTATANKFTRLLQIGSPKVKTWVQMLTDKVGVDVMLALVHLAPVSSTLTVAVAGAAKHAEDLRKIKQQCTAATDDMQVEEDDFEGL